MKKNLLTAIFAFTVVSSFAQSDYSFTNSITDTITYTDISATGTNISMTDNENGNSTVPQNIGFNFTFNGTVFTQFMIHADGILRFGTSAPGSAPSISTAASQLYGNVFSSSSSSFSNIIAAFFCDLVQGSSTPQFHVLTEGAAPNRICTIQWKNLRDPDNPGSTLEHQFENLEFQIKLFETSNDIQIVYGTFVPSVNGERSRKAAMGIKASSSSFTRYLKSSSASFVAGEFINQPANATNGNIDFAVRNNNIPPLGFSTIYFGRQTNDIAVSQLYVDDYVPVNGLAVNHLKALVKNEGTSSVSSIPVTLTVSGANTYSETINITSLASGAQQVVSFSPFSLSATGDQVVKIAVNPAGDNRTENNSLEKLQKVTNGQLQNFDHSKSAFFGNGFSSSTGMVAVKIFNQGVKRVSQIRLAMGSYQVPIDVRIYEDDGTGNTPGPTALFTTAAFKTNAINEILVPVNPTVTVTDNFYIVVAQRSSANMGWIFSSEFPISPQRYYTAALNGTVWTESSQTTNLFANIVSVVTETSGPDVGIEQVANPSCNNSENEAVSFVVRNFSNATHDYAANPVTITGFVKDHVNNLTVPFTVIKNSGSIAASGTDIVTVLPAYNFTAKGYHQFSAKTVCTGDAEPLNDSLDFYIFNKIIVSQSPADSSCPNSTTTLTASTSYISNHIWYRDRNLTNQFATGATANVNMLNSDSVFYLTALDFRNCLLIDSVIVRVKKNLAVRPDITSSDTVLSHRNGFDVRLHVAPLTGHTISWLGSGTVLSGGTAYQVSGIQSANPQLQQASYNDGICNGVRDTIFTVFSSGVLMDNNDPLTVCDTSFYDEGGAIGNYSGSNSYSKTFTPVNTTDKLVLSFYHLALGSSSNILVYDGPDNTAPLMGTLTASNNGSTIQQFASSNTSGVITVEFNGNFSSGAGFLAGITCMQPMQYRTIANGNFNNVSVWESKPIGSGSYTAATRTPLKSDDLIEINHNTTITEDLRIDQVIVNTSGHLQVVSGKQLLLIKTLPDPDITVNGVLTNNGFIVSPLSAYRGKIIVNGTLENNSNISVDSVIMKGSGVPSVLSGNGVISTLKVNSTTGITINGNQSIEDLLDLQLGIVTVNPANYLLISAPTAGNIQGGSSSSYIDGRLRRQTFIRDNTDTLFFPVGDNNLYRKIGLVPEQNSFDFYVEYEVSMTRSAPPSRTLPPTLTNVNQEWYHTVTITNGVSNFSQATITIYYENGDGVTNASALRIAKDDGASNWIDLGGTGTANGSGQITSDAFTSFSDFVLANIGTSTLPLQWLSFTGKKINGQSLLEWKTDNETNTSHFVIERSPNGSIFESIGTRGAANSNGIHSYSFTDVQPLQGINYYRLKQVDRDGRFTYSNIIRISFDESGRPLLLYPNPAEGYVYLIFAGKKETVSIKLYDGTGRWVKTISSANQSPMRLELANLPAGKYYVQVSDGETTATGTFLKQ